jgi:hypothetical protein
VDAAVGRAVGLIHEAQVQRLVNDFLHHQEGDAVPGRRIPGQGGLIVVVVEGTKSHLTTFPDKVFFIQKEPNFVVIEQHFVVLVRFL